VSSASCPFVKDHYASEQAYPARWNTDDLQDIFIKPPAAPKNDTPAIAVPSSTPERGSTNNGAVAGGAVAGVVALILVVVALWYFRFRKPKRQKATPHPEQHEDTKQAQSELGNTEKDRPELGHGYLATEGRRQLPTVEEPGQERGPHEL